MSLTNIMDSPPLHPTAATTTTAAAAATAVHHSYKHHYYSPSHSPKDNNKHTKHDPSSIPALLNNDHQDEQDFLPTPVTPVNGFPLPLSARRESNGSGGRGGGSSSGSVIFAISGGAQSDGANKRLSNTSSSTTANADKSFMCGECDQTFTRPHNLKSHLATHSQERPFQCEICNHHFRRQHDLKRHKKLHTGERPYVCKSCSRSFARLDALNRHQRAEGGSACTNASSKKVNHETNVSSQHHHRQHQQKVTPRRCFIPELDIPHPASQPLAEQAYPHPPPAAPPPANLLPSPNVLSTLPVSESPDLVPIQPFARASSSPSSSSSSSSSPSSSSSQPSTTEPYHQRHHQRLPQPWERLEQENSSLRDEIARLRAACEKKDTLASEVHDLRIENKVLRSLIMDAKRDRPDDGMGNNGSYNKRHRS